MDQVRLACVGCGGIAQGVHLPHIVENPKIILAACADIDGEKARDAASRFHAERHTTDTDSLWADPTIDAALIATPVESHIPLASEAVRHGKHVLIEKPLGTDAGQCREFTELLRQTSAKCMVGYCFRFNPTVLRARDYVVAEYSLAHVMGHDRNSKIRYIVENLGHALDLLFYFHRSEPVELLATGDGPWPRPLAEVDRMTIIVRFANNTVGTVVTGQHAATTHLSKWYFKMCGSGERTAEVVEFKRANCRPDEDQSISDDGIYFEGHRAELELFADCILEDEAPPITAEDGLRAAVMMDAAFRSYEQGRTVRTSEV